MRIIAGKYKKTPLLTLEGNMTRPTKDMVKEAMFSSISISDNDVFLDLFSGSGAIGLEALSRGAKDAVFNDINKDAVKIIKANLLKVREDRKVFNLDYDSCLKELNGYRFDYVFIDPPYAFDKYDLLICDLDKLGLLNDSATVIVEVNKNVVLENRYSSLVCYKEKKYGISKLYYYRKEV